jgi:hypothetical protein
MWPPHPQRLLGHDHLSTAQVHLNPPEEVITEFHRKS